MSAYSEFLSFLKDLPETVTSCSFDPSTGAFSVSRAPTPPKEEPRRDREEKKPARKRDTELLSRTAPVFGVES